MKSFKFIYIALTLMALLMMAACGSDNEDTSTDEENQGTEEADSNDGGERTVTDAMGHEVTVPEEPKRVIASYLEDYLVALDIKPVAQWSVSDGASVQGYLQDSLEDVPTLPHDLPLETVASFEPDLLLMDSAGMVEGNKYDQYSKIAPTYVVGEAENNDWREELKRVGEVFGKEEEAAQVLEDYEQKAAETKEQVQSSIGDESVAAIWLVGNTFYVVNDQLSAGDVLYNDLDITKPNVVKEIAEKSTSNWSEISLEKLAQLDADHIFLINSDGEGAEKLQDDIWKNIPAVKNGNIYEYAEDKSSWLYTGPVANTMMLEDIKGQLVK
ncbi:ABC transporter substrate-binding protein [Halobacillus sp. BBL2006]|uniref:ABC transporter substrate-binding protein n=1 Tax=Halobacillus sp. BBL2006 TaxID=1543706 RepID=UPI0005442BFC|nr:ABC transporter substrate-binding protein [Halobacillus sp. BBL2006]KHE70494.1 ABC transporter substrate-binding protein [Halobacillus sp. BBL2006]